jgi:hypothetical protein
MPHRADDDHVPHCIQFTMGQFKASEEDWQRVEAEAIIHPIPSTICELRERVAALEAPKVSTGMTTEDLFVVLSGINNMDRMNVARHLMRHPRIGPMLRAEQQSTTEATPEPEPSDFQTLHSVAFGHVDGLRRLGVIPQICDTLRRAIREPMADLTPEPNQAPAGDARLVEEVVHAMRATPLGRRFTALQPEARAAIRAVAQWLRSVGNCGSAADLEREANR